MSIKTIKKRSIEKSIFLFLIVINSVISYFSALPGLELGRSLADFLFLMILFLTSQIFPERLSKYTIMSLFQFSKKNPGIEIRIVGWVILLVTIFIKIM